MTSSGSVPYFPDTKVGPWDPIAMKKTVDESMSVIIEFYTPIREIRRNFYTKLMIMILACSIAAFAQFMPIPFPSNRVYLGIAVILYFLVASLYQIFVWFFEKDYVFRGKSAGLQDDVYIRTQLPKGTSNYVAIIEQPKGVEIARFSHSIGSFFTEEGVLCFNHQCKVMLKSLIPNLLKLSKSD